MGACTTRMAQRFVAHRKPNRNLSALPDSVPASNSEDAGKDLPKPSLAADTHFPEIYQELHALAKRWFRSQPRGHTLQPTALVHEAYIRMARQAPDKWCSRTHFFAVASIAMRQILISHDRGRRALRRGAAWERVEFDENLGVTADAPPDDLQRLSEALEVLEGLHPRQSRVVDLRFLGGLTVEETARVMGIAQRTVKLDWQIGRAWLQRRLEQEE